MFNQSVLRGVILACAAMSVSLATAQSVYAPTATLPSAVSLMPAAPVNAPQWAPVANQAVATIQPRNPAVMPTSTSLQTLQALPGQQAAAPVVLPGQQPYVASPGQVNTQAAQWQQMMQAQQAGLAPAPNPAFPATSPQPAVAVRNPVANAQRDVSNPFVTVALANETVEMPDSNAAPFTLDQSGNAAQAGNAATEAAGDGQFTSEKVDTGALRYYASKRDLPRVGAEMRRLKSLYPGWEPPSDLFSPKSTVDEQPLWDMFAVGNYSGIRAKVAAYKSVNPEWNPSEELVSKLATAEARLSLEHAFASGYWAEAINIAHSRPQLLVCDQMQVLWNVGESLARLNDFARSFELYKYILTNCGDSSERLATVQKASLLLPEPGVNALVAMGRVMPDGSSEFEDVGFNPIRNAMGIAASGDLLAPPVSDDQLRRFAEHVQRHRSADDAGLFGWYYYSKEEWAASHAWFSAASYIKKDPKLYEGVILSLRKLEKSDEALDFARKTRKLSPDLTTQYVQIIADGLTNEDSDLKLTDDEFTEYQEIVQETESALGAQAIGWRLVESKNLRDARKWFTDSVDWEVSKGGVIGLAVVAARMRHYKTLRSIRNKYGDQYAELARIRR